MTRVKRLMVLSLLPLSLTAGAEVASNVFGVSEKVLLRDLDLAVPAKLDTGAVTASLSAQNIELFERGDEEWVRFELAVDGELEGKTLEKPLSRSVKIRRRAEDIPDDSDREFARRPVVEMDLCIGEHAGTIEVNLTDRTAFSYPLLIGTTALKKFDAMVDPALSYEAGDPRCS